METVEENIENNDTSENQFLDYCIEKIDTYLAEQNIPPTIKRKFKETSKIHGTVYKFSHFGVEVSTNQVTIFGKYVSEFFDIEYYENKDKLLEALLPRINEFHQNPVLTKHPFIRFFSKLKNR